MKTTERPTLGVLMIVKNEENKLAACLGSVSGWVDDIVILDSGSVDQTESIARAYTENFQINTDWQGFGVQRQRAQAYLKTDWILALDADEIVTPELKESILHNISHAKPNTAYQVNRLNSAFGQAIKHSGWSPDWVVRLYKRDEAQYDDNLVHEKLNTNGLKIKKLKGRLHHDTYENLHHYLNKTTGYLKAWTDQREGKKKSGLSTALLHAFGSFFKMYVLKLGFLDGKRGFILAWLTTHSTFVKYIDLYLREDQKNQKENP